MTVQIVKAPDFVDARGAIMDLLGGPIDSVTRIFTKAGAVRGNHFHRYTTQWTYVLRGQLQAVWATYGADGEALGRLDLGPADLIEETAGVPHAWKATTDCDVLVFTRGPRSGRDYESDVVRLDIPLI